VLGTASKTTPAAPTVQAIALAAALVVHAVLGGVVWRYGTGLPPPRDVPVEIEVRDPPPPELRPEPPPPPPPEPAKPKIVARRLAPREPQPPLPPETPPPPNQEPPPEAPKNAPPVFGITQSSVVTGGSSVSVPVGNTTMTKERSARAATPNAYPGGDAAGSFQPVPDVYVAVKPRQLACPESSDYYPPDARSLGIEGQVRLSVGISNTGAIVQVKVSERAGYGFDEAATRAMWKCRFTPAMTSDGRAVPYRLIYTYTFTLSN
jgi:periplasmic protein TonB